MKNRKFGFVALITGILLTVWGCGADKEKWSIRSMSLALEDGSMETTIHLSIDVNETMSEKEMLSAVKTCEKEWKKENGEVKNYYVIFYDGESSNSLGKYKYENEEFVELTQADGYIFDSMVSDEQMMEKRKQEMVNGEGAD